MKSPPPPIPDKDPHRLTGSDVVAHLAFVFLGAERRNWQRHAPDEPDGHRVAL